ncbi:MAG: transglutaminase domain-containing protein [Eubacteriaceae bacterium]|nr:transglutaminase domain-containing protein [Eubacteriaceae bacterium]
MSENELIYYLRCSVPSDIYAYYLSGDFDGMRRLCSTRLRMEGVPEETKKGILMVMHLAEVAREEFRLTEDDVLTSLRESVPDYSEKDLDGIIGSGYLHWRFVDGRKMFFSRAAASILKGLPSERAKAQASSAETPRDTARAIMQEKGFMRVRNRIISRISLTGEASAAGKQITVHLPLPRENEYQTDIVIERISPQGGIVSPAGSLTRTVCWKDSPAENTCWSVEYSYTCTQHFTDTTVPSSGMRGEEDPSAFLGEQEPQIVFSPLVRMTVKRLTEDIDDPMERARAVYDYITLNMKYSYMPPYILMPDIVDECLRSMRGDCGVFALTMITLLRCAGIPARWQSGLAAGPESAGCHDWLLFYTPSHGWLPADPSYGTGSVRDGCEERRRFYFGNLDPWRMIANDNFMGDFDIPKKFFSIDPYDNQLGEIESAERGFMRHEVEASHELVSSEII